MERLIKRYGSRKLYDTQESRYILLEDIADLIRAGEDIHVVDNKTGEDVTSSTLTQVISEEGRKKANFLSSELLHDLIRAGETAVNNSVKQFQDGVDRFFKKSIDRFVPISGVKQEMALLRSRLNDLENAISETERQYSAEPAATPEKEASAAKKPAPKTRARSTSAAKRKTTASKRGSAASSKSKTTARKRTTSGSTSRATKSGTSTGSKSGKSGADSSSES
jgi:polyhydroxyalkanoate synthesis repressor PhaR